VTRDVVVGAVLGLALALILSPVLVVFQHVEGQLVMAAVGGAIAWLRERWRAAA
jgi:hypothetical protein